MDPSSFDMLLSSPCSLSTLTFRIHWMKIDRVISARIWSKYRKMHFLWRHCDVIGPVGNSILFESVVHWACYETAKGFYSTLIGSFAIGLQSLQNCLLWPSILPAADVFKKNQLYRKKGLPQVYTPTKFGDSTIYGWRVINRRNPTFFTGPSCDVITTSLGPKIFMPS